MSVTITLASLLSPVVGVILFLLAMISIFFGSWPDSPRNTTGDLVRNIVWIALILWLIGRVVT